MAAIDYRMMITDAIEAALNASPVITDHVKINNLLYESKPNHAAKARHARAPADFAEIYLRSVQDPESLRETTTPTFGLGRVAGCDAIIPISFPVLMRCRYDQEIWAKKVPSGPALEVEARRALMAVYPKMGFPWMRLFTIREKIDAPPDANIARIESSSVITFDLRLHLSQLSN